MSQILVVGPYPLYRLGVANALRQSDPRVSIHQADSISRLPMPLFKGARGLVICGQTAPEMSLGEQLQTAGCESATLKVLISERCGRTHRQLLAEGVIDLLLPMSVSCGAAETYLKRLLVDLEPSVGFNALRDAALCTGFLPDTSALTRREKRVLLHLHQGLSNEVIAERMEININTVKVHMAKICRKTGIRNRTHAAALCNQLLASGG